LFVGCKAVVSRLGGHSLAAIYVLASNGWTNNFPETHRQLRKTRLLDVLSPWGRAPRGTPHGLVGLPESWSLCCSVQRANQQCPKGTQPTAKPDYWKCSPRVRGGLLPMSFGHKGPFWANGTLDQEVYPANETHAFGTTPLFRYGQVHDNTTTTIPSSTTPMSTRPGTQYPLRTSLIPKWVAASSGGISYKWTP
jgi:hypothetical protein